MYWPRWKLVSIHILDQCQCQVCWWLYCTKNKIIFPLKSLIKYRKFQVLTIGLPYSIALSYPCPILVLRSTRLGSNKYNRQVICLTQLKLESHTGIDAQLIRSSHLHFLFLSRPLFAEIFLFSKLGYLLVFFQVVEMVNSKILWLNNKKLIETKTLGTLRYKGSHKE